MLLPTNLMEVLHGKSLIGLTSLLCSLGARPSILFWAIWTSNLVHNFLLSTVLNKVVRSVLAAIVTEYLDTFGAISRVHSCKRRGGIPSGPHAFEVSRVCKNCITSTLSVISICNLIALTHLVRKN